MTMNVVFVCGLLLAMFAKSSNASDGPLPSFMLGKYNRYSNNLILSNTKVLGYRYYLRAFFCIVVADPNIF